MRVAKQGKEESCQKQRDMKTDVPVSRRNRERNEGDSVTHVVVSATSLVLAFSYDNKQTLRSGSQDKSLQSVTGDRWAGLSTARDL